MSIVAAIVPALSVVLATLLAVLPWGVPANDYPFIRHLLPLLPCIVVHFWLVRRPAAMPAVIPFLAGLLIDVVTRGPLGMWPLIFLAGAFFTGVLHPVFDRDALARWLGFVVTAIVLGGAQWAVASGFYLRRLDVLPIAQAVGLAVLAYPLVATLLTPLAGGRRGPGNPSLARRS